MILATMDSIDSLDLYKKSGADAIILSIPQFSIHNNTSFELPELKVAAARIHSKGMKVYVNMLKMLEEQELETAEEVLLELSNYVDGIYYGDEGLFYLAKKHGLQNMMVYQPETLVTSGLDAKWYMDQGVQSVSLAHELSLNEIEQILEQVPEAEVLVAGFFPILYSRRMLLSNYLDAVESDADIKPYEIVEAGRTARMPVLQSNAGTFIFSAKPISSIKQLPALKKAGLTRMRIDGLFLSDLQTAALCACYAGKEYDSSLLPESSDVWYHKSTSKTKEEA